MVCQVIYQTLDSKFNFTCLIKRLWDNCYQLFFGPTYLFKKVKLQIQSFLIIEKQTNNHSIHLFSKSPNFNFLKKITYFHFCNYQFCMKAVFGFRHLKKKKASCNKTIFSILYQNLIINLDEKVGRNFSSSSFPEIRFKIFSFFFSSLAFYARKVCNNKKNLQRSLSSSSRSVGHILQSLSLLNEKKSKHRREKTRTKKNFFPRVLACTSTILRQFFFLFYISGISKCTNRLVHPTY